MFLKITEIIKNKPFIILFVLYLFSHMLLININIAEWGDSYRILRAALQLERGEGYPIDEKRPPLMSILLSVRPDFVDPVLWGRLFVFVVGALSFVIFFRFSKEFVKDLNGSKTNSTYYLYLVSILYIFNPVIFYWSLRIMTDVLFLLLVLSAFYVLYIMPNSFKKYLLLGSLVGLSILTRFEGYILAFSMGLGLVINIHNDINKRNALVNTFAYSLSSLIVLLPYFIYRNPFSSSYLSEPAGRAYDLNMVIVFLTSLFFLMGTTGMGLLLFKSKYFYKRHITITLYLLFQTLLVLLWPAAVPRLFIPLIPFLSIIIALNCILILNNRRNFVVSLAYLFVTALFVLAQYKLRLQFLIVEKEIFVLIIVIQFFISLALFYSKKLLFLILVLLSCTIWSLTIVWTHKDIYTTLIKTTKYAISNLKGDVLHNDTASIVEWMLNDLYPKDAITASFKPLDNDKKIDYNKLVADGTYEYLLVTNEERPYFNFSLNEKYLEEVYASNEFVNGANFYTYIFKVKHE